MGLLFGLGAAYKSAYYSGRVVGLTAPPERDEENEKTSFKHNLNKQFIFKLLKEVIFFF